jgi:hypothetical protein
MQESTKLNVQNARLPQHGIPCMLLPKLQIFQHKGYVSWLFPRISNRADKRSIGWMMKFSTY